MLRQPVVPGGDAALSALFARVSRQAAHPIIPINDLALAGDERAPPIYCIHALSGAGGSDFVPLARLMPHVRFFGIQAPIPEMSDITFGLDVESLADFYADALVRAQPVGPFMLGGWSAGAVIALELAHRLRANHHRDVNLLASFDAAPENVATGLRPWHPSYLYDLARNLPGWARHEGLFNRNSPTYWLRCLWHKSIAGGRTAMARARGEDSAEGYAVDGFMDTSRFPPAQKLFMRRLYGALLRYRPAPYPGRVVVYEATINPPHRLRQVGRVWQKIAPAAEIVRIAGATHLSIIREPHVHGVARDLAIRIAEAGG